MTQDASAEARRWLVSARSRGELLTSAARSSGVELVMVGVPSGYSSEEVESWLQDLMGMALESSRDESGEKPIPALLHHLLTGLLFSHAELWDKGGESAPTSVAFVQSEREVAFGWVNGAGPQLWLDDHQASVEWVRIRDQDGREACALAIDRAHRVRVHFGFAAGATVDAAWVPEAEAAEAGHVETPASLAAPPATSTIARAVGARAATPESQELAPSASAPRPAAPAPASTGEGWTVVYEGTPSEPLPDEPPSSGGWWSNVVSWVSGNKTGDRTGPEVDPSADDPRAGLPDQIPPTPESAELTERTAPVVHPEENEGQLPEIQLSPLAPEDPTASAPPPAAPTSPVLELESARLDPAPRRRPAPNVPAAPAGAAPAKRTADPKRTGEPKKKPAPRPAASPAAASAATAPVAAPPRPAAVVTPETDDLFVEPNLGPRRAAETSADGARIPRRLRWAEPSHEPAERPIWMRPWVWGVAVAVLFLVGWLLGGSSSERTPFEPGPVAKALRTIGLGGAYFDANIDSEPSGAWVTVDGKELARRTPTHVELPPGTHQVTFSFGEMGSATFELRGARGDKAKLSAPLWGSLEVYSGDGTIPVAVAVDGEAQGLAPVTIDKLKPGTHEVRFSGPGLQPWGQTVQIKVKEKSQMLARAVTSPATGILEIRAKWTDAEGSDDLTGATVYLDGEKRGATPLTLELPRGPHSVRVESRGEKSAVQVIDLPGGNQRFANFEVGLGIDQPTLEVLNTPIRVPLDQPSVISAALQGVSMNEAREMWLHVRQPDGAWRRYSMNMMKAPGGVVGTSVFPNTFLDAQGRTTFYVSGSNSTGDEYFSEVMTATEQPGSRR